MLTRTIFVGSSVLSVGMVGYLASITKLHHAVTVPTTVAPVTTTTPVPSGAVTGATGSTAPVTTTTVAPVTTTTTCYTSPSGNTVCN